MKPQVQHWPRDGAGSCCPSGAQTRVTFWLGFEVHSTTHQELNSELLPCALPAFGTRWSQNLQFVTTRMTHPVVPPTGEHDSEMPFAEVSPFVVTPPLVRHQAGVQEGSSPPCTASSSPLLLQPHQRRPEGAIKAHQAQLPPAIHPPSARAKGGCFCYSRALQGVFSFRMTRIAKFKWPFENFESSRAIFKQAGYARSMSTLMPAALPQLQVPVALELGQAQLRLLWGKDSLQALCQGLMWAHQKLCVLSPSSTSTKSQRE